MGMLQESTRVAVTGSGLPQCYASAPEARWGVKRT